MVMLVLVTLMTGGCANVTVNINMPDRNKSSVDYSDKGNWAYFGEGEGKDADLCYRLLEDYFEDEKMQDRLVAVYAIGWPCTKEMVDKYPQINPAESETDTGVVISIDCEAPDVTETFITPKGTKAYTINPLNWKTDDTPAVKEII